MSSPFKLPITPSQGLPRESAVPPHLYLDCLHHAAILAGKQVSLSAREFALLELLVAHAGTVLSRTRILHEIWPADRSTNVVDVYINYLRRKLSPSLIRTVRGVGYRLEVPVAASRVLEMPRAAATAEPLPGMIGDSRAMQPVYRLARSVAPHRAPVLITGATGTGKELVAQAIHALSPRASRPMVTINCAAIPETLLESELFGCARGAFTGAVQSRLGRIHAAHGGTLFLDEVGELPLPLQAKLLRFLESGEVQRLGSPDVFQVDVRVVAASNANLARLAAAGAFRPDLYYRLAVFPIPLPPLADRTDDILPLARHFLPPGVSLSAAAEARLQRHHWPGNVRELRHAVERAAILAAPGSVIAPEHVVL